MVTYFWEISYFLRRFDSKTRFFRISLIEFLPKNRFKQISKENSQIIMTNICHFTQKDLKSSNISQINLVFRLLSLLQLRLAITKKYECSATYLNVRGKTAKMNVHFFRNRSFLLIVVLKKFNPSTTKVNKFIHLISWI